MTPIDDRDEYDLNSGDDRAADGAGREPADEVVDEVADEPDGGEITASDRRSWQDEVDIDTDSSAKIADADLDPTLGYDLAEADGPENRSMGRWLWILLGLVVVGVGGWWWWSNRSQPEAIPELTPVPTQQAAQSTQPEAIELPTLSASDEFIRRLVSEIAAHPALTRWLANDGLVRRFVGAIEVVSAGGVPRDNLDFLNPNAGFEAEAVGQDIWRASAAGHQRFDQVMQVMQLIDPADAARIVKTTTPLADEARRDLGYPEGGSRAAIDRAVAHLVRVSPQLASEPLVREGETYRYQDGSVEEGLSSAQKALLRLGPEQAAWVQAWLHRFHDALSAQ